MPMPHYACCADSIRKFGANPTPDVVDWDELFNGFGWGRNRRFGLGPQTVKFFVRPECYKDIPVARLGEARDEFVRGYRYRPGEIPVLFAYGRGMRDAIDARSPLRRDGFVLVLEWRKDAEDSPLLSTAFHLQAQLVRDQLKDAGRWGLWPAKRVYADKVDFTDREFFADEANAPHVASSYGALLSGLWCAWKSARRNSNAWPDEWSYPTLKWDGVSGTIAGVVGLEEKFSAAADCGAKVVAVAQAQKSDACSALRKLRQGAGGERFGNMRVCGISDRSALGMGRVASTVVAERIGAAASAVRRRLLLKTVSYGAVILSVCLGFWLHEWDRSRDIVEHCEDYVNEWGIPDGIDPITRGESHRRWRHFELVYRKGKCGARGVWVEKRKLYLHELNYCNAEGLLRPYQSVVHDSTRVARRVFESDEDGVLARIRFQDEFGQDLALANVSSGNVFDLSAMKRPGRRKGMQKGILVGRYGVGDRNEVRPTRRLLGELVGEVVGECGYSDERCRLVVETRTHNGLPKRILYYPNNRTRNLACGVCGEYGVECSYDERGRLTRGRFLARDGLPKILTNAVTGVLISRGRNTNEVAYVDSLDVPQTNQWGWVCHRTVVGPGGRLMRQEYVGTDGKPMFGPDGYAAAVSVYRDHDPFCREIRFEDPSGRLTYVHEGAAIARVEKADRLGRSLREGYYDVDDKPCLTRLGYSAIEYVHARGRETERYFDDRGRMGNANGHSERTAFFDRENRLTKVFLHGADHVQTAGFEVKYRDDGLWDRVRFLGPDGKTAMSVNGMFDRVRFEYEFLAGSMSRVRTVFHGKDETAPAVFNGKPMVQELELDERGNLVGISGGCVTGESDYQRYTYDEYGRITCMEDFSADRKTRVKGKLGCAVTRLEYLEDGQPWAISHYGTDYSDANRKLTPCTKGYARMEQSDYTIFGRPRRQDFYDADRRLMYTHFHEYDSLGREVDGWKVDADGRPFRGSGDLAERRRREYDPRGNCIVDAAYTLHGEKALVEREKYHRKISSYDNCGRLVKEHFEDCRGNRVPEASTGVWCYAREYDHGVVCRVDKEMSNGMISQWVRKGILYATSPDCPGVTIDFVGQQGPGGVRLVCAVDGVQCFGNQWLTVELLKKNPGLPKNVVFVEAKYTPPGFFSEVGLVSGMFTGADVLSSGRVWMQVIPAQMLYASFERQCRENGMALSRPYPGTPDFKWQ